MGRWVQSIWNKMKFKIQYPEIQWKVYSGAATQVEID